jgi:hypothetical protein
MLDRGLTKLIKTATQRTANGEAWPWGAILVAAYLMRRSLRTEEPARTMRVSPGEEVTVSVRDPDD